MKNKRTILVYVWGICMCVCLMAGCQPQKETELSKTTENNTKKIIEPIKERTETVMKENTENSQKKEISKIEIKWWAPCGSQEEDKYYYVTEEKLISQIQKEAEETAKKAEIEGKYIGDDSGLTGSSGYRLVFYNENKVIKEIDIVNGIIMGIDDGEMSKYYEMKEISLLKYLENSNFPYEKISSAAH